MAAPQHLITPDTSHRADDGEAGGVAVRFQTGNHAGDIGGFLVLRKFELSFESFQRHGKSPDGIEKCREPFSRNLIDGPWRLLPKLVLGGGGEIDEQLPELAFIE